ncbi:hypothetical protein AB6A40_009409 [Gnathostoma spinigerum]|uniref:Uncharacterized protein n=1 Tax=Gnathostoma spinigerum TaxID=75299 RepID=A0ABD6ERW0_9BILA
MVRKRLQKRRKLNDEVEDTAKENSLDDELAAERLNEKTGVEDLMKTHFSYVAVLALLVIAEIWAFFTRILEGRYVQSTAQNDCCEADDTTLSDQQSLKEFVILGLSVKTKDLASYFTLFFHIFSYI